MQEDDVTEVLNDFVKRWTASGRGSLYRAMQRWPLRYAIASLTVPGVPLVTFECKSRNGRVVATHARMNKLYHKILAFEDAKAFREELLYIMNASRLFGPIAHREVNLRVPVDTGEGYPQFGYKRPGTSRLVWVGNSRICPEGAMLCRKDSLNSLLRAELGFARMQGAFGLFHDQSPEQNLDQSPPLEASDPMEENLERLQFPTQTTHAPAPTSQ